LLLVRRGFAFRSAGLEQRAGVEIAGEGGVDPRPIVEGREHPREVGRREMAELQVERGELGVGRARVIGRQEQVVVAEDEADLVKLGLPDAVDPLAEHRRGEREGGEAALDLQVDPGVKGGSPELAARLCRRRSGELIARRAREEDHLGGQAALGATELAQIDDGEERLTGEDIRAGVRHREAEPGEAKVALDHPAEQAGIDEEHGGAVREARLQGHQIHGAP
jgi:hypothetical protein